MIPKFLIISLLVVQGLYVVFPLPDIWPISNYSMFSRAKVNTVASKLEIRGVTEYGEELPLDSNHFYPVDGSRINKGISRILDSEKYSDKNEKRIDRIIEYLNFLPVNKAELKQIIQGNLLYSNKIRDKEDKAEAMSKLFEYLLEQYRYNKEERPVNDYGFRDVYELRLYRIKWDWTETPIQRVRPEEYLIYSTKTGINP